MDCIKGFIDKMQLDRDFRISLREAKTKEAKMKIIKQSGFDVSEKDIQRVVENISRIADEKFHDIDNNWENGNCQAACKCKCRTDIDPPDDTKINIEIE